MTYDDLLPFIWPSCTACPRDTVIHHTRLAAIEFFDDSGVWQIDLDTLLSDGFTGRLALPLNDQCDASKLILVSVKDAPTTKPYEADITNAIEGRRAERNGCTGLSAWLEDRATLGLAPVPIAGAEIDILVALKPSLASFTLPDEVLMHHAQHIAHGALSRILRMPRCDWSDAGAATLEEGRFRSAIDSLAMQSEKGFARKERPKNERFF